MRFFFFSFFFLKKKEKEKIAGDKSCGRIRRVHDLSLSLPSPFVAAGRMISEATCRRIVSPLAFRQNFLGGIIAIVIKILRGEKEPRLK